MSFIAHLVKFNRSKPFWANYKPAELGAHIERCESHIDACEQLITNQNGSVTSFFRRNFYAFCYKCFNLYPKAEIIVFREAKEQSVHSLQAFIAQYEYLNSK